MLLDVGAVDIKVILDRNAFKYHAIKDAKQGKVPKDYAGAYVKSMKRSKSSAVPIKAVTSRSAEAQGLVPRAASSNPEIVETYLWPVISALAPLRIPRSPPNATRKQYNELTDSNDEESEAVKALAQLTSNVRLESDKSQSCPKSKRKSGEIDMAHIQSVAQHVKNGDIRLPDLSLETNCEYD